MTWCHSCGAQYAGAAHNCGWRTITADRLRELEEAEKAQAYLASLPTSPHKPGDTRVSPVPYPGGER